ncbi:helix-turn-helix domain-containing protein [Streptomyces sp. NPDC001137]|uniref:winged helix-turn-helix transcriptional regulator n=1 Tax=Streptomyces sp. NPDC001137 TaxID=3154378 RepID=UPI00332F24C7
MAPPRTQAVHQPGPERLPEPLEALTRAFALLGTRGTGLVITALAKGPADLHLLHERVPGLSDGLLTRRLREMTALGLVVRTDHPGTPTPTLYTLASHGKALLIPLAALTVWAQDHLSAQASEQARAPQRDRAGAGHGGPSGRATARGDSASS